MQQRARFYPLGDGITLIDDAGESTCYVVEGPEKALIVDTLNGLEDLHALVRRVTDKPLVVFNTHGHCDHIYGNMFFDEAYLNRADWAIHDEFFADYENYVRSQPEGEAKRYALSLIESGKAKPCPLKDIQPGDTIDLGGRVLEAILVAGHTPGSLCLLDRQSRTLFTGDALCHQLWMQLDHSTSIRTLLESLNGLDPWRGEFDRMAMGHGIETTPASFIDLLKDCAEDLLRTGGKDDLPQAWFGGEGYRHMIDNEHWIFYTKDKL